MNDFYDSNEKGFSHDSDAGAEASHFEDRMNNGSDFYMDPSTIDQVFEHYRQANEAEKARKLLTFAIDRFPFRAEYYFHLAVVEFELDNLPQANHNILKALEFEPFNPDFLLHHARILFLQGREPQALASLNSVLDYANETGDLFYQMGMVCQHAEHHELAIEYFKNALTRDAAYDEAICEVLFCYEQLQQPAKAIQFAEAVLNENPFSSVGWFSLATLYQANGLYENAIQAYEYALAIEPGFTSAAHGKGMALAAMCKWEDAVREFQEALDQDPNDIAILLAKAECHEELNDAQCARKLYYQATTLHPTLPEAWLGVAATLESEGRNLEAIKFYLRTTELDSECIDAWAGLAECEYAVGNHIKAFEALRNALALDPADVDLFREWAERLAADNRLGAALDLLEHGLRLNPKAYALAYQYAAYAFTAGHSSEAFLHLENALLMDFEQHKLLYEFSPRVAQMRPIQELIAQYQPRR